MERKAHFNPEIVGAAAAYRAWQYYEIHDAHKAGGKVSHLRGKQVSPIVALKAGYRITTRLDHLGVGDQPGSETRRRARAALR